MYLINIYCFVMFLELHMYGSDLHMSFLTVIICFIIFIIIAYSKIYI